MCGWAATNLFFFSLLCVFHLQAQSNRMVWKNILATRSCLIEVFGHVQCFPNDSSYSCILNMGDDWIDILARVCTKQSSVSFHPSLSLEVQNHCTARQRLRATPHLPIHDIVHSSRGNCIHRREHTYQITHALFLYVFRSNALRNLHKF